MTVELDYEAVRWANAAVTLGGADDGKQERFGRQALARLVSLHDHGPEVVGRTFASMSSEAKVLVLLLAVGHLHALTVPTPADEGNAFP